MTNENHEARHEVRAVPCWLTGTTQPAGYKLFVFDERGFAVTDAFNSNIRHPIFETAEEAMAAYEQAGMPETLYTLAPPEVRHLVKDIYSVGVKHFPTPSQWPYY